jgi:hypothetical protein
LEPGQFISVSTLFPLSTALIGAGTDVRLRLG